MYTIGGYLLMKLLDKLGILKYESSSDRAREVADEAKKKVKSNKKSALANNK